jgi:hypothetical protein
MERQSLNEVIAPFFPLFPGRKPTASVTGVWLKLLH